MMVNKRFEWGPNTDPKFEVKRMMIGTQEVRVAPDVFNILESLPWWSKLFSNQELVGVPLTIDNDLLGCYEVVYESEKVAQAVQSQITN